MSEGIEKNLRSDHGEFNEKGLTQEEVDLHNNRDAKYAESNRYQCPVDLLTAPLGSRTLSQAFLMTFS